MTREWAKDEADDEEKCKISFLHKQDMTQIILGWRRSPERRMDSVVGKDFGRVGRRRHMQMDNGAEADDDHDDGEDLNGPRTKMTRRGSDPSLLSGRRDEEIQPRLVFFSSTALFLFIRPHPICCMSDRDHHHLQNLCFGMNEELGPSLHSRHEWMSKNWQIVTSGGRGGEMRGKRGTLKPSKRLHLLQENYYIF